MQFFRNNIRGVALFVQAQMYKTVGITYIWEGIYKFPQEGQGVVNIHVSIEKGVANFGPRHFSKILPPQIFVKRATVVVICKKDIAPLDYFL